MQIAFDGAFDSSVHFLAEGRFPGIVEVRTDANSRAYAGHLWHSDVSCEPEQPVGSILYLHQVPASGGDTLFANMYAAYEALSAPMRAFLEGLSALHSGKIVP